MELKNRFCLRKRKSKSWISPNSWKEVYKRRQLKQKLAGKRAERLKVRLQQEYKEKDREVKRSLRKDKKEWADNIA